MKPIHFLYILFLTALVSSCENVVELDLENAKPRLVIEAAIEWPKGSSGNQQTITLTTTSGFYDVSTPVVTDATVYVTNSNNTRFDFIDTQSKGKYTCNNFVPKIGETYTLTVITNNQTYTASETLQSVTPITRIEQNNQGGFTGNDIEVKAYFNDPSNENNFYLFHYIYSGKVISNYYADSDKYYQGNEFFSLTREDDLKVGDEVTITHFGISERYYNYMNILISVSGGSSGGPFQSPPATVRGNIINQTNSENYPLGYFSLSESDTRKYTIQ